MQILRALIPESYTTITILTILLTPVLVLVSLIVALASFGASFGLRKMYVKALLKIFEVCCSCYFICYVNIVYNN
jgi:hypothetical protein